MNSMLWFHIAIFFLYYVIDRMCKYSTILILKGFIKWWYGMLRWDDVQKMC